MNMMCTVISVWVVSSLLTLLAWSATIKTYASSNTTSCVSATVHDYCILYCDTTNSTDYVFNCGHARECGFFCQQSKCAEHSVINAVNTGVLTITSSASQCLKSSVINLPNYGDAFFSMSKEKSFEGMTINSGTNTGQIMINCTLGYGDECTDTTINAQTATYLEITVGSLSHFGGDETLQDLSQINCPINSEYNGPETAPCIIDLRGGGLLSYVEINTMYGIPRDLWIKTGNVSLSKVIIKCYDEQWSMNNGESLRSEQCWNYINYIGNITNTNSTQYTTDPVVLMTLSPPVQPDLLQFLHNSEVRNFGIVILFGLFVGCCLCCGCCVMILQCQQLKHNKEMNHVINNFMSSINNMLFTVGVNTNDAFPLQQNEVHHEQQIELDKDTAINHGESVVQRDRSLYTKYNALISPPDANRAVSFHSSDGIGDGIITGVFNGYNDVNENNVSHEDMYREASVDGLDTKEMEQEELKQPFSDAHASIIANCSDGCDRKRQSAHSQTICVLPTERKHAQNESSVDIMHVLDALDVEHRPQSDAKLYQNYTNLIDISIAPDSFHNREHIADEFVIEDDDDDATVTRGGSTENEQKVARKHQKTDTQITMFNGKPTKSQEFSEEYDAEADDEDDQTQTNILEEESEEYDPGQFEQLDTFELDDYEGKDANMQRNRFLSEGPKGKRIINVI